MKTEIKALYKKDPKLAKEVAKVLGFKIKASTKAEDFMEKMIKDLIQKNVPDNKIKRQVNNAINQMKKKADDLLGPFLH